MKDNHIGFDIAKDGGDKTALRALVECPHCGECVDLGGYDALKPLRSLFWKASVIENNTRDWTQKAIVCPKCYDRFLIEPICV